MHGLILSLIIVVCAAMGCHSPYPCENANSVVLKAWDWGEQNNALLAFAALFAQAGRNGSVFVGQDIIDRFVHGFQMHHLHGKIRAWTGSFPPTQGSGSGDLCRFEWDDGWQLWRSSHFPYFYALSDDEVSAWEAFYEDIRFWELTFSDNVRTHALSLINAARKVAIEKCVDENLLKDGRVEAIRQHCDENLITITFHKRTFAGMTIVPDGFSCLSRFGSDQQLLNMEYSTIQHIAKSHFPNNTVHILLFHDSASKPFLQSFPASSIVYAPFNVQMMMGVLSDFHVGSYHSSVDMIIKAWRFFAWKASVRIKTILTHTVFHRDRPISPAASLHNRTHGTFIPICSHTSSHPNFYFATTCRHNSSCCPSLCIPLSSCECSEPPSPSRGSLPLCNVQA
jgi:hypothetical protein